ARGGSLSRRLNPLRAPIRRPPGEKNVHRRAYDGSVGLSLVAGPANAGKVALLLERYLARLDDEPFLIVPNRSDVDQVERDLLARSGCLLGGSIGTFDDLFERIAAGDADRKPVLSQSQRLLAARRAVDGAVQADRPGQSRAARCAGFVDPLLGVLGQLAPGLPRPR